VFRWGWLFLGALWGVCLGDAARYSNQNYEAIKATLDGVNTGARLGPLILLFTVASVVIFILLLIIGLIALRRRPGFWSLVVGVFAGMGGSGVANRVYQAIW
jgi:hypothetical protein